MIIENLINYKYVENQVKAECIMIEEFSYYFNNKTFIIEIPKTKYSKEKRQVFVLQ